MTIGQGGRVEICSPDLKEGDRAEVIVLVEKHASAASRLAAFKQLQESLNLDEAKAREWIETARSERESFGP